MIRNVPSSRRAVSGFSMVELLIAMAIGVFLSFGLVSIYTSSKQGYWMQDAHSKVQENGRFGTYVIGDALRRAGYREFNSLDDGLLGRADAFPTYGPTTISGLPRPVEFAAGQVIAGEDDLTGTTGIGEGDGNGTDVLYLRYQGTSGHTTYNCLGGAVTAQETWAEMFYVSDAAVPELRCAVVRLRDSSGSTVDDSVLDDVLIEGVENFQVRYGMDIDGDPGNPVADCYLDASTIATGSVTDCNGGLDFSRVVSVRVGLLLHSPEDEGENIRITSDTGSYELAGETISPAAADRRMRMAFNVVVGLRNVLK